MRWNQIVKDYLTFTRKDRAGILILLFLLLLVFLLPHVITNPVHAKPEDSTWITAAKKLQQNKPVYAQTQSSDDENDAFQYHRSERNSDPYPKAQLFYFNPNTASNEEWKKLGLREKTIRTIQNYLAKGGQFRKPTDLQKIYGLQQREFERLFPYIKIVLDADEHITESTAPLEKYPSTNTFSKTSSKKIPLVDINESDTSAWIALPGIGSKLAWRIVNFRNKLGGFYSVKQVAETYGIADSVFQKMEQYLVAGNTPVKKININTADVNTLKMHPYIKWNIANAIVQYRQQHESFKTIDEILKIMIITQNDYQKIAPYITVE